jgi:6-phosphogluconolactonase (cycloisomerase 2 family)
VRAAATGLMALLLLAAISVCVAPAGALAANPIVVENAKPGDEAWRAAVTAHVNFDHPAVDGYANATSVRPGATIDFSVNIAHPGRYRVEIVRLGWYRGMGGRRLTCLTGSSLDPSCTADEPGVEQPAPPSPSAGTGEVDAGWSVTDRLRLPRSWVTGYYLAIFQVTAGPDAGQTGFTPFIVQAPVGDRSQILVQVPTNTWEAYNEWGGEDLYTSPRAVKVSFNRPYQHRHLFRWEYPLVRFLERSGDDVTYVTDDDVDRDPGILLDHRLDMTAGHGEYWTRAERDGWGAARAHGVNLAFMGANTAYWQVRYQDDDRTMVSYKSLRDPEPDRALKTIQFRDLTPARPECELLGEQYAAADSEDGQYFDYKVTAAGASDPWFAGSGLRTGSLLDGVVGFEFDSVQPSCHVPPLTALLHWSGARSMAADAVRYRACSGSEVFDAGSLFFSWGLDSWRDPEYGPPLWAPPPRDSPALQRVMRNLIADMLEAHPRFRAADAVRVVGHGSYLRIDPGVRTASVSVRGYALGFSRRGRVTVTEIGEARHRRSVTWRLTVPRAAVAVMVDIGVRTGDVVDSRRFIVPAANGTLVGPAQPLSAASCYGPRARVITAVFGGPAGSRLRVAVDMPRPLTLTVLHHGTRVGFARIAPRRRTPAVVEIGAAGIPCGRVTIVIADRGHTFRLGAIRACPDPPGPPAERAAAAFPGPRRFFGVPGSPFATGRGPETVAFAPGGHLLASVDSGDGSVSLFSVAPGGTLTRVRGSPFPAGADPDSAAFGSTAGLLATADYGANAVSMFSVSPNGRLVEVGPPFPTGGQPDSVAFGPTGKLLATANQEDDTVSVFSVAAGGQLTQVIGSPFPTGAYPESVAFSSSGGRLATANPVDDTVSVFSVASSGELTPVAGSPFKVRGQPNAVAFSPSGGLLAIASSDQDTCRVSLVTLAADRALTDVRGSPYVTGRASYEQSVAFSATGRLLASVNADDDAASVFSVSAAGSLSPLAGSPYPTGNGTDPLSVAFNPSGALLATANFDADTVSVLSTSPPSAGEMRTSLARQLTPRGRQARIGALLRKREYALGFTALRAGRVAVRWYDAPRHARRAGAKAPAVLVAALEATFSGPEARTIDVELTANGRRLLEHARRLTLTVHGTFTPAVGHAVAATRRITLAR